MHKKTPFKWRINRFQKLYQREKMRNYAFKKRKQSHVINCTIEVKHTTSSLFPSKMIAKLENHWFHCGTLKLLEGH